MTEEELMIYGRFLEWVFGQLESCEVTPSPVHSDGKFVGMDGFINIWQGYCRFSYSCDQANIDRLMRELAATYKYHLGDPFEWKLDAGELWIKVPAPIFELPTRVREWWELQKAFINYPSDKGYIDV